MALVAGIDEAGYGPLLGPLVVTGVVFETRDDQADRCLWSALSASICAKPGKKDHRVPVCDSKALYDRKVGLSTLELTALVTLAAAQRSADTFRSLLAKLACHTLDERNDYPWYRGFDIELPADQATGDLATRANAVRRDWSANDTRLRDVFCSPVLEGRFNQLVQRTRNKASVLLSETIKLIHRVIRLGVADTRIHVDHQGGRISYRPHLMTALPEFDMRVLEESEMRSAYLLSSGAQRIQLDFVVECERRHMPVALASVYSKYVRELFMIGVNSYWQARVDGLAPTAGYYADAQRFLSQIEPAMTRLAIDRNMLVRCR